jgi:predicted fused transcriptional regulator/phosphomethylpyrimidine kinase
MAPPGTYPVPPGRGRWRLTLHSRVFAGPSYPTNTGLGELTDARSRKLEQALNTAATLSFTLDGHSPTALAIRELAQDVIAWRWDDQQNRDVLAFRGCITQAQDTLSEQTHTVAFTAHDYLALMARRFYTNPAPLTFTQQDQDNIAAAVVGNSFQIASSSGTSFVPGSYFPVTPVTCRPDGTTNRPLSGQLRDRTITGQASMGETLDQLAKVINGFDYDYYPNSNITGYDSLRLFYPYQGILRTSPQLMYGSTVSTVTRTLDSANYANYERVVGNNGSSDPTAAQLYGEAWNTDANNVGVSPQGLWMNGENASDVTIKQTLTDKANGDLSRDGVLVPSYAVGLRPGAYSWGNPNMGDVIPLIIQSGRLNVNTTIRVMGVTYDIGDDGQEDVALTLGRPDTTFADIFTAADRDVNALARR